MSRGSSPLMDLIWIEFVSSVQPDLYETTETLPEDDLWALDIEVI